MKINMQNCEIKIKSVDIGEEEAIRLYNTEFWKDLTPEELAAFQSFNDRLCMPFDTFHEATEKALGRPVWSHEFAFADNLREELEGKRENPTFQEILDLIPSEKRIVVVI